LNPPVYRITKAGWLHARQEILAFQLSKRELILPDDLPQTPFIGNMTNPEEFGS
jgi:hypothetical protein